MNFELIIVRYGEIGLKAKQTRNRFETRLIQNIKSTLDKKKISSEIKRERGRIYLFTKKIEETIPILNKIFGIISFSPAVMTNSKMGFISDIAVDIAKEKINENKSFALVVTRQGTHSFSSQDVAVKVGDDIVNATGASVDLSNPDFNIYIEIREENSYLFNSKKRGVGGLPLGTEGRFLALIDDYSSLLAAWYLMKRGSKPFFLNQLKQNNDILSNFLDNWYVQAEILDFDYDKSLFENINYFVKTKKCQAVVTGDTIMKNRSEIIGKIKEFKEKILVPVLNPLIAMEEKDILKNCEQIGIKI